MYPLYLDNNNGFYNSAYEAYYGPEPPIMANLQNKELWDKFNQLQSEMIITKNGRNMFPTLQVNLSNLEDNTMYCVWLDFSLASNHRYKYSSSGGWAPAGTEEAQSFKKFYIHPDSPLRGKDWMSRPVSFSKVKMTNTPSAPPGQVVLSSMHKYQPTIVISRCADLSRIASAPSTKISFPETNFIAVTAYQNDQITKLKINHNPFAKGFRDSGKSKKRKRTESEEPEIKIEDDRLSLSSSEPSTFSGNRDSPELVNDALNTPRDNPQSRHPQNVRSSTNSFSNHIEEDRLSHSSSCSTASYNWECITQPVFPQLFHSLPYPYSYGIFSNSIPYSMDRLPLYCGITLPISEQQNPHKKSRKFKDFSIKSIMS